MTARREGKTLSPASRIAVHFIRTYQERVSGRIRARCPFEPSCNEYGFQAFQRYGFPRATRMTIGRLRRCNARSTGPFVDPP